MSKLVPIGLGAAAVIAVLFVGSRFISSPGPNVGGPASRPPASASPSEAPASATPTSAAPSPIAAPPLTQSFKSPLHGISLAYPDEWTADAATEPWTDGPNSHSFDNPQADHLLHPTLTTGLFLTVNSQPIGDSTPEDWIAQQIAEWTHCPGTTKPIAVDGATGLIGGLGCHLAVVTTDGRGYWISLRASQDDPAAVAPYNHAWFEGVLATVQLHPEDAVDVAPSATP